MLKLKLYQQLSFFFFLNPIAHFLVFVVVFLVALGAGIMKTP
ncbi:hypothetical protein FM120_17855 [Sphingobacterium faecium PCAi_F2.5]|nr:hypothetical protein FM120_17855 [Sphingobacterium faecium PCAi_F2.5]